VEQLDQMNKVLKLYPSKSHGHIDNNDNNSNNLVKYLKRGFNKLFRVENKEEDMMRPKQSDLIPIRGTMESIMNSIISSNLACSYGDLNPVDDSSGSIQVWIDTPIKDNLVLILKEITNIQSSQDKDQDEDQVYAQAIVTLSDLAVQTLEKIDQ